MLNHPLPLLLLLLFIINRIGIRWTQSVTLFRILVESFQKNDDDVLVFGTLSSRGYFWQGVAVFVIEQVVEVVVVVAVVI